MNQFGLRIRPRFVRRVPATRRREMWDALRGAIAKLRGSLGSQAAHRAAREARKRDSAERLDVARETQHKERRARRKARQEHARFLAKGGAR